MNDEIKITYKRQQGAAPNYPPEDLAFPADAHIAPCNNCGEWLLESDLSKTAEVICPHGGPKISQSIPKGEVQFSENFIRQIHEGDEIALIFLCDVCRVRG